MNGPRITVVDYGAGNVVSVLKALAHVGVDARLSGDPAVVRAADVVVFPGQGHFGQAMARLRQTGLDDALREVIAAGRPFIGICLGLQLLFSASDEAPGVAGLDVLPGRCVRFPDAVKVPQIGWNELAVGPAESPILDVDPGRFGRHYYFVHSYHARCEDAAAVAATAEHGEPFVAAVARDNLFAAQFHPEKSGRAGIALLRAFLHRAGVPVDVPVAAPAADPGANA